ncbi:MAG: 1-deoxy-D-xylulose-5-phosphate synthase [Actinomycetota bacterium]|nr:1-deoxy-D-xylulose-5-phosphate synthase [Actinomycetota bacterium]
MRRAFVDGLVELGKRDERIVLLTADLGFAALEPFEEAFPTRFFNVGVSEQNMIGMSTGLAEAGFIPYAYSISTFASMRAYEFLRNGPVLHGLPVRVVGIGEGLDYGHNGMTHYALEDVALMRVQPDLAVVTPADDRHVRPMLEAVHGLPGPAYIRLSKNSYAVPGLGDGFELGCGQRIGDGEDVAIVALGGMAATAVTAAELLAARGVAATVLVVESVNPPPTRDLVSLLGTVPLTLSIEAHYVTGGLGSLVAEVIAEHGLPCRLVRAGVQRQPVGVSGTREFTHDLLGLTPELVADTVLEARGRLRPRVRAADSSLVP